MTEPTKLIIKEDFLVEDLHRIYGGYHAYEDQIEFLQLEGWYKEEIQELMGDIYFSQIIGWILRKKLSYGERVYDLHIREISKRIEEWIGDKSEKTESGSSRTS